MDGRRPTENRADKTDLIEFHFPIHRRMLSGFPDKLEKSLHFGKY
jgi:hypothetical protein